MVDVGVVQRKITRILTGSLDDFRRFMDAIVRYSRL